MQRIVWIDYAKVCLMVFIVFYHTPPRLGVLENLACLLCLASFFFVAGLLFKDEKYNNIWQFILHRCKQLLVPYFFFFLFFYTIWLLFGREMAGDTKIALTAPIIEFITGRPETICGPMWFVVCLFSVQVIYYLLNRILPSKFVFLITCLMPFLSLVLPFSSYFMLNAACVYIPFYAFANTFKDFVFKFPKGKLKYVFPVLIILSVCYLLFVIKHPQNIYTRYGYDYTGVILFTLIGIMIILQYVGFMKFVAKILKRHSLIETIGKNIIVILATHNYIIGIFKILAYNYGGPDVFLHYPILKPLITIMVFVLSYYPIILINKYIPFILGRGYSKK
ncbi:MAG: acyltransferase family protein [Muribaculaceae bacterium]|nr:acyltransferase family protein [Muribaculaceae bacterium]